MNKDDNKERKYAFISVVILMVLLAMSASCSNVVTALEIPQHIQQRILDTENTYVIDVKYLVWNDVVDEYEWEYYSDFNYEL
jgi:hypothetical protein